MEAWKHQKQVIPVLLEGHYILAWEPGVGKTLPLLTAAKALGGRTLYLGPPAIRTQVANEAVEFGLFSRKQIQVVLTGKDKIAPQAQLVVCGYEHAMSEKIWKQLFGLEWDAMVLDEAHMLKNTAAKRTRAVYGARVDSKGALCRRAARVWLATGTPLINDPTDLWSHVSRLFPEVLHETDITTKTQWMEKFCHYRDTPYGPKVLGGRNLDLLRKVMQSHWSVVRKSDVHDLPPMQLTKLWVPPEDIDLDGVPEEAYQELLHLLNTNKDSEIDRLAAPLATLRRRFGLAKAPHIAEILYTDGFSGSEGKTIVFYHHKDVAQQLLVELGKKGMSASVAHYPGGLSTAKRDAVVKSFTKDANVKILLAQMQASGTGLNLQVADRILIAEPAWTPAANEQAISRAYRAGQKRKVWVSYICLENSVDELITSALMRKTRIISKVIQGGEHD